MLNRTSSVWMTSASARGPHYQVFSGFDQGCLQLADSAVSSKSSTRCSTSDGSRDWVEDYSEAICECVFHNKLALCSSLVWHKVSNWPVAKLYRFKKCLCIRKHVLMCTMCTMLFFSHEKGVLSVETWGRPIRAAHISPGIISWSHSSLRSIMLAIVHPWSGWMNRGVPGLQRCVLILHHLAPVIRDDIVIWL